MGTEMLILSKIGIMDLYHCHRAMSTVFQLTIGSPRLELEKCSWATSPELKDKILKGKSSPVPCSCKAGMFSRHPWSQLGKGTWWLGVRSRREISQVYTFSILKPVNVSDNRFF